MPFKIIQLPREREAEREQCFAPFVVTEKAKFRYIAGKWSWKPVKEPGTWRKHYPIESNLDQFDHVVFLCMDGPVPVGQITLCRWWNHFICVDRLDVTPNYRRKGIGTLLLQTAREWAKDQGCRGLYLETQDTNVPAMRLYEKNGFTLCGIDTMFYYNSPHRGETAAFYYLLFDGEHSIR